MNVRQARERENEVIAAFQRHTNTEDILEDLGIERDSLTLYLRRRKLFELHTLFVNMRKKERERMPYPAVGPRPRCAHGTWTSVSGVCQHDELHPWGHGLEQAA